MTNRIAAILALVFCTFPSLALGQDLSTFTLEDFVTNAAEPTEGTFVAPTYSVLGNGDLSIPASGNNHFVLLSPDDAINDANDVFEMGIAIDDQADDDYIGWVFGFQPGDSSPDMGTNPPNNTADYVLVHWKALDQGAPTDFAGPLSSLQVNAGGVTAGMYAARVTGLLAFDEIWFRKNSVATPGTYTNIATATGAGAGDYRGFTNTCAFLRYTQGRVTIYAQGEKVIDTTTGAPFPSGKWGLYFAAQQQVTLRVGRSLCFGDADFDGVLDTADVDDDNDGILDTVESGGLSVGDTNTNDLPDWADDAMPGFVDTNSDDIDDRYDADLDGVPNHLDTDSDSDGVWDLVEGNDADGDGENDNGAAADVNDDGVIDAIVDANTNGLEDTYAVSPASTPDTGGAVADDYLDNDDDGDGVLTSVECSTPAACEDSDSDGTPDYLDLCGDGSVTGMEACDDGNASIGDGCADSCLLEVGETCSSDGECDLNLCDMGVGLCVNCLDDDAGIGADTGCAGLTPFCDTDAPGFICVGCVDDQAGLAVDEGCGGDAPLCDETGENDCVECFVAGDCNDSNVCTTDSCASGSCGNVNNEIACNDGSLCTTDDICGGGSCSGTAVDCDDGLGCTSDSCDPGTGACDYDLVSGCSIGASCWMDGDLNPSNACESCDSGASGNAWTAVANCDPCDEDSDCGGDTPVCDVGLGYCVQCDTGKTDACTGDSPICDTVANVCEGCASDAECAAEDNSLPACAAGGACVECTDTNEDACTGGQTACDLDNNICVFCTESDADACGDSAAGEACIEGACGCDGAEDCGVDQICNVAGNQCVSFDSDGDGVNDTLDGDSDNDGITDLDEGGGVDPSLDGDNDGVPDYLDDDADGFVDANSNGVDDRYDFDGDGVPNHVDLDSDNDGIPDLWEIAGSRDLDVDADGRLDGTTDEDGDGVLASVDADDDDDDVRSSTLPPRNTDDGADDLDDVFDLDSDDDGLSDIDEALGVDTDGDGRVDSFADNDADGWTLTTDSDEGGTAWPLPNSDDDDAWDFQDSDSDNDGVSDLVEGHDFDGDGESDVASTGDDADGDGIDDAFDEADLDDPPSTDDDGLPNYRDADDDGDGIDTADELTDSDGNGVPDYLEGPADADAGAEDASVDASPDAARPVGTGGIAGGALCSLGMSRAGEEPFAVLVLGVALAVGALRRRKR
jgi:hypothetical protein